MSRSPLLPIVFVAFAAPLIAQDSRPTPITLDEVLLQGGRFEPRLPRQLMWHPAGDRYCHVVGEGTAATLTEFRLADGKPMPVVSVADITAALTAVGEKTELRGLPALEFASDARALQFRYPHKLADGSPAIRTWRFDLVTRKIAALADVPADANAMVASKDGAVAYVESNNISVLTVDGVVHRVTKDGNEDLHYGVSAHREEFGIQDGLWWDPTGRRIAFYREDLRPITPYPYANTAVVPATRAHGRYPMAGGKNSVVTIGVYDVATETTTWLDTDTAADWWLTNVTFDPTGDAIYVARVNRLQNAMDLVRFDAATGKQAAVLFSEKDDQWVEPEHGPTFIPGQPKRLLWLSPRGGWLHLWSFDAETGESRDICTGTHDVQQVLGFNAANDRVYYMAASNDDPRTLHLWGASLADGGSTQITKGRGRRQVMLSPKADHALMIRQDLETPPVIERLDLATGTVQPIASSLNPLAARAPLGDQRFFTVKSANGDTLFGHMFTPPNMQPNERYPALCYVYGGPHVQLVTDSWLGGANLWLRWFASQGYVVYRIDGHGTPNRGIEFQQAIHRHLGTTEIQDQLAGLEYVKSLPFVDGARVGVHGWSFGGFMTASLLCRAPDAFKCGIAGAPVTDWAMYETGYGERYMDTPSENPQGYAEENVAKYAKDLKGRLLIIHGTADDTVVWQHTLRLLDAFIDAGVDVEYFVYPGQKHGVVGKAKIHLYRKMTRWLMEHI